MDPDCLPRPKPDVESILERLTEHVHGRADLSATQVRAAEILLRRAPQGEEPAAEPAERAPVTEVRNVLVRPCA